MVENSNPPLTKALNPRMASTGMHDCGTSRFEQGLTGTTGVTWGCTQATQELRKWLMMARYTRSKGYSQYAGAKVKEHCQ